MSSSQQFIDQLQKIFSNQDEIDLFLQMAEKPLKKSISVMSNRIGQGARQCLAPGTAQSKTYFPRPEGRHLTPHGLAENSTSQYIDRDNLEYPLGKTFLHGSGFFYIQEIAASLAVPFLDIPENGLVLDMSAAPGGKSVQLCDRLLSLNKNKPGLVVSNDSSRSRLMALNLNISRMGCFNDAICITDGFWFGRNCPEMFDAVLVDAPCSGEGTRFKSDAALQYWKEEEIKRIAGTQHLLLHSAFKALKPGGSLVYSTCTLNPLENEDNVQKMLDAYGDNISLENVEVIGKSIGLSQYGDLSLLSKQNAEKVARLWPHIHSTGGFFIAKFKKTKSLEIKKSEKKNDKKILGFPVDFSNQIQKKVKNYLSEIFGIDIENTDYLFVSSKENIFLTTKKILEVRSTISFEKIGVAILKHSGSEIRPLHHCATILGDQATQNVVKLTTDEAQAYALGEHLSVEKLHFKPEVNSGYVILQREGYGIGIGKIVDGVVKNKYVTG